MALAVVTRREAHIRAPWTYGVVATLALVIAGCSGPSCLRNTECAEGLECRDTLCQTPELPPPPAPPPVRPPAAGIAGAREPCDRGFYCGYGRRDRSGTGGTSAAATTSANTVGQSAARAGNGATAGSAGSVTDAEQ